jgi:hypothetical protein
VVEKARAEDAMMDGARYWGRVGRKTVIHQYGSMERCQGTYHVVVLQSESTAAIVRPRFAVSLGAALWC